MATLSDRTCASAANLETIKDVTPDDAAAIRNTWRTVKNRAEARAAINAILRTHGAEYLGQHKRSGESVYYCNAGDAYAATVLFHGLNLRVGCWGDMVEKNLIREPAQY